MNNSDLKTSGASYLTDAITKCLSIFWIMYICVHSFVIYFVLYTLLLFHLSIIYIIIIYIHIEYMAIFLFSTCINAHESESYRDCTASYNLRLTHIINTELNTTYSKNCTTPKYPNTTDSIQGPFS
jgi:hypothetical protein